MLRLWLSILSAFLLLPEYGMARSKKLSGEGSGMDDMIIEYNMDDRLVPSKYQSKKKAKAFCIGVQL